MVDQIIAGVDEVGRGPLAGPVVAAAVVLDPRNPIEGLADSKKLTERRRAALDDVIQTKALAWSLGRAEVDEIDALNILNASLLAMKRALEGLSVRPDLALIDGNRCPETYCRTMAIIGGDGTEAAISAASIIAKVARDREMVAMDLVYPGYGFARHKGYPTKTHLDALGNLGVSAIHRRSFAPVRRCLS